MNWFKKFMTGRYGVDQLTNFLIIIFIFLFILSRFIHSSILYLISMVIPIIAYYRIFSKNTSKRYEENKNFLNLIYSLKRKLNSKVNRIKDMKYNRYYKCPSCEQTLRVPKGKGRISITCPKCKNTIIRKS